MKIRINRYFFSSILFVFSFFVSEIITKELKILHISLHKGCINELEYIAKELELNLTSMFVHEIAPCEFDGKSKGTCLYNIGHERAENIWKKNKEYFETFDVIITS